ncbi:Zn-ribbon domain-containing OB-fold protein [Deltaproteobacteria bacterium]|nr:Zn-ribbon domain-containing OB-fold protein [Deltaproteobacteria bacterium]
MSEKPFRVLPELTETTRHFWEGGREGKLRFPRCQECSTWVHPPTPICPTCLGKDLEVEAVSGAATVLTFTLNHQQWVPSPDHPYAIAIVELDEQEGLRLTTNVVNCAAEDVRIGMRVQVVFDQYEDVWIPLFQPVEGS